MKWGPCLARAGSILLFVPTLLFAGAASAADGVDVGGAAVEYHTSFTDVASSDGAERTVYYRENVLVAASWDTNADGRDDLWMRVGTDWRVDRVAADWDFDGVVDVVDDIEPDADGDTGPVEAAAVASAPEGGDEQSEGVSGVLLAVAGLVVVLLVALLAAWLIRRRRPGAVAILLVLALVAAAAPADASGDLFDEDCNINEERFDEEWEKYSDFDERVDSPSYEVQQFDAAIAEAQRLLLEAFELEMDLAMEDQAIIALSEYRSALGRDQKRNLVRAFIRMTMLTGGTIKGAVNLSSSVKALGGTVLQQIGGSLNLLDHFTIQSEEQKQTVRSAVEGVGWSVFKDTLESLGDPNSMVKTLITSTMQEANKFAELPEWKISDAEFQVLRDQHLKSRLLDLVMLEAERDQVVRRAQLESVEQDLEAAVADADTMRAAEKERVRALLIADCEKRREESSPTTSVAATVTTEAPSTTSTAPANVVELTIADVGSPGVVQHMGRSLWNVQTDNVVMANVLAGWNSTYRDASETVGGTLRFDTDMNTLTGRVVEQWTCAGYDGCHWTEYTATLGATINAAMIPAGGGWDLEGEAIVEYSVVGSHNEEPSDCNGTECYICAERVCRFEFATSATVPVTGRVEGTFVTVEFVDRLAEDPSTMDFEPIRKTEFFMSRWLHQAELPTVIPAP